MGVYLHVPFCQRKCSYCSFFSVQATEVQYEEFVTSVALQIEEVQKSGLIENNPAETIFVGGGTPSVLGSDRLADLLQAMRLLPVAGEMEISVEVNPATVSGRELVHLSKAGFNRLSIGVQSLSDAELKRIGRLHTRADATQTIESAREAGFDNCNVDLMYGLPGQTVASWRNTLNRALDLAPDHLAIYELTIEEDTPFARLQEKGELNVPSEESVLEMMAVTEELVASNGFHRYEISNYARPGRECRHNINYWRNGSYLGLGPGAVSCLDGRRFTAVRDIDEFCRRISTGRQWWSETEELGRKERFRETMIMGLRMISGVSIAELELRFGINPLEYYADVLPRFEQLGLIQIRSDRICLSTSGLALANQVMAELV